MSMNKSPTHPSRDNVLVELEPIGVYRNTNIITDEEAHYLFKEAARDMEYSKEDAIFLDEHYHEEFV